MSRFPAVIAIASALALSGCMATLEHTPEAVHVCKTMQANGWSGSFPTSHEMKIAGSEYHFQISDEPVLKARVPGLSGSVFWVMVQAGTAGSGVGYPTPPMVYQPSDAVLTRGGSQVHALPRLWRAALGKGHYGPAEELPVPYNLNNSREILSGWYYIAFPVKPPRPRDTYTLTAGSVLLDGRRTLLPVEQSCFTPARTWWYPIY